MIVELEGVLTSWLELNFILVKALASRNDPKQDL